MTVSKLFVEVVAAKALMPKDDQGSANAYCVLEYDGVRKRTRVKPKDLDPTWNEKFEFVINDIETPGDLEISISNERSSGTGRRSSFLGKVTISIAHVPQKPELQWYPLQKRSIFSNIKGALGLRIWWQAGEQLSRHRVDQEVGGEGGDYVPGDRRGDRMVKADRQPEGLRPNETDFRVKEVGKAVDYKQHFDLVEQMSYLFVRVVRAWELLGKDQNGFSDPYVRITVGPVKTESRIVKRSLKPEWNEVFAIGRDKIQAGEIEVSVWDADKLSKDNFLGGFMISLHDVPTRKPSETPLAPQWYRLEAKTGKGNVRAKRNHGVDLVGYSSRRGVSRSLAVRHWWPSSVPIQSGEQVALDVHLQELHRVKTPRNGSEVEELQASRSLNSSEGIRDDHGGQNKLEAELQVIDMVFADIPLDLEATTFKVIMECLIASVQGIKAQVVEFSQLHYDNHIHVFNHECGSLVDTLCGTVHDRLRRYNNTLSEVQVLAGLNDRGRFFMRLVFCIVALAELERMFKAVVDLLTMCTKKEWWNTAFELSNAPPTPTIPRWSSFSLAIRSCEWSMDIVDFGFLALEQFLAGASTVTGVVFKWSDKQSRMVLHIDGKPLYHDEGGSSLLEVTRDLEGKDVTALIQKLVKLNETPRKWFSCFPIFSCFIDTNMHTIADVLSQKLHGPRPDPNSLPYTFQVDPSTLNFVRYIANGSYGWVAEFKWLGRTVSVKKVKSPGLSRKQFETEAAILATVQHPRVVRMIGRAFEENERTGSLVMELMEGDLRHVIEKRCPNPARGVSPFPLTVAIDIMLQIGEGMQYLREHKILHRDLKAGNVLLNRCRTSECGAYRKFPALASLLHTEEYYIVKLADFGIANASREQTSFGTMMAGTTSWRAPEVYKVPDLETTQNYKWPADVYSFAMTCYEILTGFIPFDGVPNSELYKRIVAGDRPPLDGVKIPPLLKDLVERCWKTDPNERPNFDEICKTLWQCKVENILPAFQLQMGPSQAESV